MLIIEAVLAGSMSLIDINPNGANEMGSLNIFKNGYVAESFRPILNSFGYTDEEGLSGSNLRRLENAIKREEDELTRTELRLVKELISLKNFVNTYDYNKKEHDIREKTSESCALVSVLLGKALSLKYSRPTVCSSGSYRFPPNPAGIGAQTNYATTVSHIDGRPDMKFRIQDLSEFAYQQFETAKGKLQLDKNSVDFEPLMYEKQQELENYWDPLLRDHDNNYLMNSFDMINLWMPMNDGPVENYPLAFHKIPVTYRDFGLFQRMITFGNPLIYIPSGDFEMCYWDKMMFGDYFLFKSLKVAHRAVNLNNVIPGSDYKSNRKSFEIRCFLERLD